MWLGLIILKVLFLLVIVTQTSLGGSVMTRYHAKTDGSMGVCTAGEVDRPSVVGRGPSTSPNRHSEEVIKVNQ